MELQEYLIKTRQKRTELAKAAESALNKTLMSGFNKNYVDSNSPDLFMGPTPQKLRVFENEICYQLRKFFSPGLNENTQNPKIRTYGSVDDCIRKTYSRNSPTLKKKQLVILPKNFYFSTLKVPERIIQNKNFSLSPDNSTEPTISSTRGDTKPIMLVKKHQKGDLLLPVLATMGTHEYRSKVYKYK